MLRPLSSRTPSYGGLRERECPRCHRAVDLPLGEVCGRCVREASGRAARLARWVSLSTTLAFGLYVLLRVPDDPTARAVSGGAVVMWYVVVRMITLRAARTWYLRY